MSQLFTLLLKLLEMGGTKKGKTMASALLIAALFFAGRYIERGFAWVQKVDEQIDQQRQVSLYIFKSLKRIEKKLKVKPPREKEESEFLSEFEFENRVMDDDDERTMRGKGRRRMIGPEEE